MVFPILSQSPGPHLLLATSGPEVGSCKMGSDNNPSTSIPFPSLPHMKTKHRNRGHRLEIRVIRLLCPDLATDRDLCLCRSCSPRIPSPNPVWDLILALFTMLLRPMRNVLQPSTLSTILGRPVQSTADWIFACHPHPRNSYLQALILSVGTHCACPCAA